MRDQGWLIWGTDNSSASTHNRYTIFADVKGDGGAARLLLPSDAAAG